MYTYSSFLGSSIVDYFSTDLNPESLRAFTVSPLTPLSDHSKIIVYLKRAILNEASKSKELHNNKTFYRWKESIVEAYQKTIKQQQIQSLLDNFLDKAFHCNSESVNFRKLTKITNGLMKHAKT